MNLFSLRELGEWAKKSENDEGLRPEKREGGKETQNRGLNRRKGER